MTDCNLKLMHFSPLNGKRVEASFSGGDITSDGGLLLLREVDKRSKLTKRLSKAIYDKRHPAYIEHTVLDLLKQRVYAIAAGHEDINDHDRLCHDIGFQTAVGRDVKLASASTLSRFENTIDRRSLIKIRKCLVEHFIDSHELVPKELILDFDPTDNVIYGEQINRHYHGYYKNYCFLPLHVFCGDKLLVSLLRPSNIDGARYAGSILRLLVKRFREVWPTVRIIFRGDCAFGRKRILHWCEHNKVDYIVGFAGNTRLEALTLPLIEQAKLAYEAKQIKQRLFTQFHYASNTWKIQRQIIAKVEYHQHGLNTRYIVTTMKDSPENLYDKKYCPRGDMENGIKQLKLDLFSDRNSCHDFLANQFRLLLSSIAYILITDLRRCHLSTTKLAKAYCGNVRLKLFKIGAVVLKNTRRIQFFLSSHCPEQMDFIAALESVAPS